MPLQIITEPATEPVSLSDAKAHLRVDHTIDDTLITGLITAARTAVEFLMRRGIITQTWELILREFPPAVTVSNWVPRDPFFWAPRYHSQHRRESDIELPNGALLSVGSVKYIDANGTQQTLVLNTDYVVDTASEPGRVLPAYGVTWPTPRDQWDAVRIRYDVGWSTVPVQVKQAVLLVLSQLYKEPVIANDILGALPSQLQVAVENLVAPYRLINAFGS